MWRTSSFREREVLLDITSNKILKYDIHKEAGLERGQAIDIVIRKDTEFLGGPGGPGDRLG